MTLLETILLGILFSMFINAITRVFVMKQTLIEVLLAFFLHWVPFLPLIIHSFFIRDIKQQTELSDEELVEMLEEMEKKRNKREKSE